MPLHRWPYIPIIGFFLLVSAIYLSLLFPAVWFVPIAVFLILAIGFRKWKAMPFVAMALLFVAYALSNEFGHWEWLGMGAFFWYGVFYTLGITAMGARFLRLYWSKDAYMVKRTFFNIGAQLSAGFLIPYLLPFTMGGGAPDSQGKGVFFMYLWPLEHSALTVGRIEGLTLVVKWFMAFNLVAGLIVMPILVYYYGRRPYCSWFCGCGALAETMGDAHREKMPHGPFWNRLNMLGQAILAAAFGLLALRIIAWIGPGGLTERALDYLLSNGLFSYKYLVDLWLAGIIGVGFYFHFSGRVWCRFACPLAALMHIYARFSRFRILADKNKCISCNVCTRVCHQGIDVMSFANKGEPMADPQCVRCSACVQSCPTGVLAFGQIDPSTHHEISRDRLTASPVHRHEQTS